MFKNTNHYKALVIILLVLVSKLAFNQSVMLNYNAFDKKYGYNPHIYKGAKYMSEHRQQFGHPYFQSEKAFIGNVIAENYVLDSVQLWYDIYMHYLVYGYENHIGSQQKIILNVQEVEKFQLGAKVFIRNIYANISSAYIQVITTDSVSCYLNFRKDYKHVNNNTKKGFGYTDQSRKVYAVLNGKAKQINNNKALLNILPENNRQTIKTYMGKQKIKTAKANEAQLMLLFEFINDQLD